MQLNPIATIYGRLLEDATHPEDEEAEQGVAPQSATRSEFNFPGWLQPSTCIEAALPVADVWTSTFGKIMKATIIAAAVIIGVALILLALRPANEFIAPLVFNSRIERLHESNLPKILIEESTIYCRMKADDFRFPLPPGSRATNAVVTGGFDTVEGSVEARFDGNNRVTASEYETSLSGRVQVGGQITAQTIPEGLLIKFHYFGDR